MKIYVGEHEGKPLYIVGNGHRVGLKHPGERRVPLSQPAKLVELLVEMIAKQARMAELAASLELRDVGSIVTPSATGRDTVVLKLPGGRFGIHIDGEQMADVETATGAARVAYGLSPSETHNPNDFPQQDTTS